MRYLYILLLCVCANVSASETTANIIDIEPVIGEFVVQGKAHGYLVTDDNIQYCFGVKSIDIWLHPKQDQNWRLLGVRFGMGEPNGTDDWKFLGKGEIYPFGFQLKPKKVAHIPGTIISCFSTKTPAKSGNYWTFMEMYIEGPDGKVATTFAYTKNFIELMGISNNAVERDAQKGARPSP